MFVMNLLAMPSLFHTCTSHMDHFLMHFFVMSFPPQIDRYLKLDREEDSNTQDCEYDLKRRVEWRPKFVLRGI